MFFQKRWITTTYGPSFPEVKAEVECITKQRHLKRIAREAAQYDLRVIAIERIDDQRVLTEAAKNDRSIDVRIAALKRIADHKTRLALATDIISDVQTSDFYRIEAIETVLNEYKNAQQDLRAIIECAAPGEAVKAAKLLDDDTLAQQTFIRAAKNRNAFTSDIREAVERIRDDDALLEIVKTIADGEAANAAAQRISDDEKQQLALIEIATAKRFRLPDQLDAAIDIRDRDTRDAALKRILYFANAQTMQKSGTYVWQDKTMLRIATVCKAILAQDGAAFELKKPE